MEAQSPEKFINECDEKVTDEDGLLSRSMMIIWTNRLEKCSVFQHLIQPTALRFTRSM